MKFSIKNSRNFKDESFEVEQGSRVVFLGNNNAGKTSLLDLIYIAISAVPFGKDMNNPTKLISSFYRVFNRELFNPELQVEIDYPFFMNPESMSGGTKPNFSFTSNIVPQVSAASINRKYTENVNMIPLSCFIKHNSASIPILELKQPNQKDQNIHNLVYKFNSMVLRDNDIKKFTEFLSINTKGYTESSLGQICGLPSPLARENRALFEKTLYLKVNRSPSYTPEDGDSPLNHDTLNQVSKLAKRLKLNDKSWTLFISSVQSIFPEIQDIAFYEVSGHQILHAIEENDNIPIADMGFGIRNVVHLLLTLSMIAEKGILIIDEPEFGLNQKKQAELALILETIRPDVTIIMATQSEAFIKGMQQTKIHLIRQGQDKKIKLIDIQKREDRLELADLMGIDPLYLSDGGKIIFVEGDSDEIILKDWLKRQFPNSSLPLIKATGGCGKIKQEFLKPLLSSFRENIFLIYDSDGTSADSPKSKEISSLEKWLKDQTITNYYILKKKELENYLGHESLAKALNIHSSNLKPLEANDHWFDMKAAISLALGPNAIYSEKKHATEAYESLNEAEKKAFFQDENEALKRLIAKFIGVIVK